VRALVLAGDAAVKVLVGASVEEVVRKMFAGAGAPGVLDGVDGVPKGETNGEYRHAIDVCSLLWEA
jgi:hypothetical protein